MSLLENLISDERTKIVKELEAKLWERLEPMIREELRARHMSIAELAKYLHVSEPTVRRLIREKTIPSFRVRGQIFVRQMDVDAWIESQIEKKEV